MSKVSTCIWSDGHAEEQALLYTSLVPDSHIDQIMRAPSDNPSSPQGAVLLVTFTLAGTKMSLLNGGPDFPYSGAISLMIATEDQAETDRLSDALIGETGEQSNCGWLKDRWGLSWQITPKRLLDLNNDPDPVVARAAFGAMMTMKRIDIAAIEAAVAGAKADA
jgi:predicted 3-demethylubiquinone-9 3-methyltransferase (glyoxalase superfamily)